MADPTSPTRLSGTALGFIAIAFAMVGLIGLFATFAAPLPLERAIVRERTLDAVLSAAQGPDPAAALEALRPVLDDSADAVLPAAGQPPAADLVRRVAQERTAMRLRLEQDSATLAVRLRWLVCIVTVMAGVFSVAILHAGRR